MEQFEASALLATPMGSMLHLGIKFELGVRLSHGGQKNKTWGIVGMVERTRFVEGT